MPTTKSSEERLPRRFGEFLLFDKIGQGGMAEIFLAKSLGTLGQQRLTVIKRVLPLLSADPQFSEMLVTEAKLCASVIHKNVVQVTDLGRVDEQLYIAMEYIEGFDLSDLLRRCTRAKIPMPSEFVFLIIEDMLRALDVAHRAKDADGRRLDIIHRDVSPTNVLISCEGEVKLCDFGIAKATALDGALPQGVLKGKFGYMSPEQARGEELDQRSDIFAAGILLWEMIAGRRLYRGDAGEILSQAQVGDVPPLPDRGLPQYETIAGIVQNALSAEPDERYQSTAEMLEDIGDYVHEAGLFASQLRFARFLQDHFGEDLQRQRRDRERLSTSMANDPSAFGSSIPEAMVEASPPPPAYSSASPGPHASAPPARSAASSPWPRLEVVPEASPAPVDASSSPRPTVDSTRPTFPVTAEDSIEEPPASGEPPAPETSPEPEVVAARVDRPEATPGSVAVPEDPPWAADGALPEPPRTSHEPERPGTSPLLWILVVGVSLLLGAGLVYLLTP